MPHRVLIADDDDLFRETLAAFLRKSGYECASVPDSETALKELGKSQFDLVISDLDMPGNTDLAFIRELSNVAPGLPAILLTAHPTIESAAGSVRLPVAAYLVKPPQLDEMLDLVRQAIDRYQTFRTVSANRLRLQSWLKEVAQIEELLAASGGGSTTTPAEEYLGLTFQNLLLCLADLKQMIQTVARQEGKEDALSQVSLVEALRKTIEVLAKTRQSFKSKELGELRRQLEDLLQEQ